MLLYNINYYDVLSENVNQMNSYYLLIILCLMYIFKTYCKCALCKYLIWIYSLTNFNI